MTFEQATALIDAMNGLTSSINHYGALGCGLLMSLIFAVTWRG